MSSAVKIERIPIKEPRFEEPKKKVEPKKPLETKPLNPEVKKPANNTTSLAKKLFDKEANATQSLEKMKKEEETKVAAKEDEAYSIDAISQYSDNLKSIHDKFTSRAQIDN